MAILHIAARAGLTATSDKLDDTVHLAEDWQVDTSKSVYGVQLTLGMLEDERVGHHRATGVCERAENVVVDQVVEADRVSWLADRGLTIGRPSRCVHCRHDRTTTRRVCRYDPRAHRIPKRRHGRSDVSIVLAHLSLRAHSKLHDHESCSQQCHSIVVVDGTC